MVPSFKLLRDYHYHEDAATVANKYHSHNRERFNDGLKGTVQWCGVHPARSPCHARWFSTSSASSDSNGDADPAIEVTVTSSADQSQAGTESDDDQPQNPSSSGPTDQEIEEEILSLQSAVRTHHRHAAYGAALDTAAQLLALTSSHFGNLHPATASAHNNVGLMNKLLGNYSAAKEAYHEALRVYGEVCGQDHASYAAALSNLGMLERGRVLESEAEDDEGEQQDGGGVKDEEGVGLQQLRDENDAPTSAKSKMSAMERMQLMESAIEYFDEAHRIRLTELGPHHPHTITSRSQLGSAMAAAIMAERKGQIGGRVEAELRKLKQQKAPADAKEMEAYVPEAIARAAASIGSSSRLTRRRWEAAEEHLRGALTASVENPRGESVSPLVFLPIGGVASSSGDTGGEGDRHQQVGLTLPLKKDRSLSEKERRRTEKKRRREMRQANFNALQSGNIVDGSVNPKGTNIAVQGAAGKVTTLSAATAAQNLAVFLKNYSDWMRLSLMDEDSNNVQQQSRPEITQLNQTIQESRHLYEAALHVRARILPPHHPEVVASKFSLAELLDSPTATSTSSAAAVMEAGEEGREDAVDGDRATELREEILNAYNVEERGEEAGGGGGAAKSSVS